MDQDRTTLNQEIDSNFRIAATGFIVGAILGALAAVLSLRKKKWKKRSGAAERPPIIVKGGSLIIENHRDYGYVEWAEDGDDWTPDQDDGDEVQELFATLDSGSTTGCQFPIQADKLEITYRRGTHQKKFKLKAHRGKPKVGKEDGLQPNGKDAHQLIYDAGQEGEIVRIKGGGKDCRLSADAVVRIEFR